MAELHILFDHAAGYALFKSSEFEEDGFLEQVVKKAASENKFKKIVSCEAFQPFRTGRDALENINCISEGILHSHLEEFLLNHLPKSKKKHPVTLGVADPKLGAAISEKLEITCTASAVVAELTRGIRRHFHSLVEGFEDVNAAGKAQLGLGHSYSRARVKFNVNRIDNMIIQSISLVDQLDKDINTFTMRVREWYSHHFPELVKVVPENNLYMECVKVIRSRKEMPEDIEQQLFGILNDETRVAKIIELARSSMGMDISELDLNNVYLFAERILSLTRRRKDLMEYLRSKMTCVAPNLAALIGEVVGARLIAHAGSLINLAKYPASTVQILGAEKALFRALKTRGNTPKYGLIFHSRFIGKAAKANKGRISRFLANKCSVASRIDCFRDNPTDVFGSKMRDQVEERLKFYETGELPKKNVDVMQEALQEAEEVQAATAKALKKAKKKAKKEKLANSLLSSECEESGAATEEEGETKKKKKKKRSHADMEVTNGIETMDVAEAIEEITPKKKKKKSKKDFDESGNFEEIAPIFDEEVTENSGSAKKKKKKKKRDCEAAEEMY